MPSARFHHYTREFGVTDAMLADRVFVEYDEASSLVVVAVDADGREHQLAPEAAAAWQRMQAAAAADGVALVVVSAFRSIERQAGIVRRKLAAGQSIAQVLSASALPGCSEHHTGRAVDIASPGGPVLQQSFESTAAYAWLQGHAADFGFRLSFPRGNPFGFMFEPWHWCHHPVRR